MSLKFNFFFFFFFFGGGGGGGGVHYKTPVLSYLKVGKYVILKTSQFMQAHRPVGLLSSMFTSSLKLFFLSCD